MTWKKHSIGTLAIPLAGYGGNHFLGVGKRCAAHVSDSDGVDWTSHVIDSNVDWGPFINYREIAAFGNGTWFVHVTATKSKYFTSKDNGKNWSTHTNSNGYVFGDVIYSKSKFIGIEHSGNQCVTSSDGVHWQTQSFPSGMNLPGAESWQIVEGQNNIVASRSPHDSETGPTKTWFAISSDGINWSKSDPVPFPCRPLRFAYSDSSKRFVAIVRRLRLSGGIAHNKLGVIKSDDDGQTWQEIKDVKIPLVSTPIKDIKFVFGNGRFIMLPKNHHSTKYPTTDDGKTWKLEDLLCVRLSRIQFGNSKFVVTGGNGILVTGT